MEEPMATTSRAPGLEVTRATPATTPDVADLSVGQLVSQVSEDLSGLMKAELALAKAELKEEVAAAGKGAGMFTGAGIATLYLLGFGSLALMFGLGTVMGLGWAALIVTGIWGVVAAVLALSGKSAFKRVRPGIPQTVESVKEDVRWVRAARN
jgi:hypothetical protein